MGKRGRKPRGRNGVSLSVGERIAFRRRQLELSQDELGARVDLTGVSISRIESGGQGLSIEMLGRFAEALSTTRVYLLGEEPEAKAS